MIVDEAHGLHEGVDRGRTDKTPAAFLQVLRDRRRRVCLAERAQRIVIELRRSRIGARLPRPEIGGKRTEFLPQFEGAPGVVDRRVDLAAMPNDPGVLHQPLDVGLVEFGDPLEVEACEGGAEILTLAQDRQPRKAGLEAFKADFLEQARIGVNRTAPFVVVIGEVIVLVVVPEAAQVSVRSLDQSIMRHDSLHVATTRAFYQSRRRSEALTPRRCV